MSSRPPVEPMFSFYTSSTTTSATLSIMSRRESRAIQRRSLFDSVMAALTWSDRRLIVLVYVATLFSSGLRPHLVYMLLALVDVVSFSLGSRLYRGTKVLVESKASVNRITVKWR
ncbi:hypothetical protein RRG08_008575 [Elysia crispata]|uniref:Uncharacterized protein n=1 Tax=Elysia crispata TaxID=231223 RepID=A0AAE0Y2L1_9GAST|nr:hypothetical protein RRG08_008575 [Elysia crispata]